MASRRARTVADEAVPPQRRQGQARGKKRGLSLVQQVMLFVALSLALGIATLLLRDKVSQLGKWGYLGAFFVNGVSSATIFFPAPGAAILAVMARDFNPFLLGLAAGLGGTLGSSTSYVLGHITAKGLKKRRFYPFFRWLMLHVGGGVLFFVTLMPFLPSDAVGILAGATGYSLRRFYLWIGLASVIKMMGLMYAASLSLTWLDRWLGFLGWGPR